MANAQKIKISLKNISKSFYLEKKREIHEVVKNVSIDVFDNEFLVLLGPGRSGKTVLLNIISELETPTCGEIIFTEKRDKIKNIKLGFIFQKMSIFPWLTVEKNVEFGALVKGMSKSQRREKANYFIELVGLKGFEKFYPNELSGGMKQRVGIARAYCYDPEILLMDEPFGALDAQTRYQMEDEILRIWEKERRTIVFVTNNIEEAVFLGDRIVLLSSCPARVKKIYTVSLPRPREYTDPIFLKLREEISSKTDLSL